MSSKREITSAAKAQEKVTASVLADFIRFTQSGFGTPDRLRVDYAKTIDDPAETTVAAEFAAHLFTPRDGAAYTDGPYTWTIWGDVIRTSKDERVLGAIGIAPFSPGESWRGLDRGVLRAVAPGVLLRLVEQQLAQQASYDHKIRALGFRPSLPPGSGRPPKPDAELWDVADRLLRAQAEGAKVYETLSHAYAREYGDVPTSTVRTWIKRAEQRDFLGKARGRSGRARGPRYWEYWRTASGEIRRGNLPAVKIEVRAPAAVADELERAGVLETRSDEIGKSASDLVGIMLQVYNVPSTLIGLAELPGRVAALRDAFAKWIGSDDAPDQPYTLEAHGPGGRLSYELDSPPDMDALEAFLVRVNEGALDPEP